MWLFADLLSFNLATYVLFSKIKSDGVGIPPELLQLKLMEATNVLYLSTYNALRLVRRICKLLAMYIKFGIQLVLGSRPHISIQTTYNF